MKQINIDEMIKTEWRELGFYYDRDDGLQEWLLYGSRNGLMKFVQILNEYANESNNDCIGNDAHYGPYSYLKICTWENPSFSKDNIGGPILSLKKLAALISEKLLCSGIGDKIIFDKEFSNTNTYKFILVIMPNDFDPISKDPNYK